MKYMITWNERPQGTPTEYESAQKRILEVFSRAEGEWRSVFPDILFHRMSVMAMISAAIAQEPFRNNDAKHANIATTAAIAAARKPGVVRSVSASVNRPPVSVGRRNRSLAFSAANSFSSCDTRRS